MIKFSKKMKTLAIAGVAVASVAGMVVYGVTAPCAVYADGTKIYDPYVVKAGDQELFLVKDGETAENVIETVIESYAPEGAQINSITVDKRLSADVKKLKRSEGTQAVLTEEEAVDLVVKANETEDPLFSVTINAEKGEVTDVGAGKDYEETDDLYQGQTKVKSEGVAGSQVVTNEITSVNGNILTSEVVDTAVVKEAVNSVVYKGTKERPKDTIRTDYSGKVMGSGNGASVAAYACKFGGTPYRYGGTDLRNGVDCSGFVQSVYRNFGISLPRTADAQAYCGKGVSLSEAKAGDLICYYGHIGIYVGGGNMVHASSSRGVVVANVHSIGKSVLTVRRIVE